MAARLRGHSGATHNPVAQAAGSSVELSSMSANPGSGGSDGEYITHTLLNDAEAVDAQEAKVAALVKYQGFHNLKEMLAKTHDENGNEKGVSAKLAGGATLPSNDYIAACLMGPAAACKCTADNLGTNAIVAGLLLTVSLSYAVGPPDVIVAMENGDPAKVAFVLLMNVSAGFSFLLIIFAAQFAVAGSRAVRDSDKMRVLLHIDSWLPLDPNSVGVVSMYGTVITLVAGMVVASYAQYGTATSIASAAVFIVLVALGIKVGSSFVFAGHISFYWKDVGHAKKTDPVDLQALEELMELKVKIGQNLYNDYKARHHIN